MKCFVLTISVLYLSFTAQSQGHLLDSLDICGHAPPGWVTTLMHSDCSVPGNPVAYYRRIKKIEGVNPGFSMLICSDWEPIPGWASSDFSEPTPCKVIGSAQFFLRGIQKIAGLPNGTIINEMCGDEPPGWITTDVYRKCSIPGYPNAYYRKIQNVTGEPPGFPILVCSPEKPPPGWVSSPYSQPTPCAVIDGTPLYLRGLMKIAGMPHGSETRICGPTPDGWVTTEVYDTCSIPGYPNNYYKKILNISNAPIDTSILVCSDEPPPPGWVQSPPSGPNPCKVIDGKEFFLRGFVKVSNGFIGRCCVWHNNGTTTCVLTASSAGCKGLSGVTDVLYDWKEGASCTTDPCGPPVHINMARLEANYDAVSKSVKLSWQFESEEKIDKFYITRSRENENFKTIGLQPDNTGPAIRSFEFTDINPYQIAYYQLHWVKGNKMYSSQVIKSFAVENQELLLYPNPATGNVRVVLSNMQLYTTQVSVTDLSGRSVLKQTLTGGQYEVDLSSLPQGLYVVRVFQNGRTYTEKLIKK